MGRQLALHMETDYEESNLFYTVNASVLFLVLVSTCYSANALTRVNLLNFKKKVNLIEYLTEWLVAVVKVEMIIYTGTTY